VARVASAAVRLNYNSALCVCVWFVAKNV